MAMIPSVRFAEFEQADYVGRRQPCLITDGLAACEGMRRWTPEYLAEACGDVLVAVEVSESRDKYALPHVPLRDAVRWITGAAFADRQFYVQNEPLFKFQALCQDVTFPKPVSDSKTRIWVGSGSTVSGLHHDAYPNWFAQAHGRKQFILFSPDQIDALYPRTGLLTRWSSVDPLHPDLEAFPKFAAARPLTVTVQAGEVLFLPAFWWHHVSSQAVSISVNQWWRADLFDHCNRTGARTLLAEYQQDGWSGRVQLHDLRLEELLAFAERAAARDQTIAALALSVVLDTFDRWPDQRLTDTRVEPDVRQGIESLRRAVLDETVYAVAPDTIAALARRVRHAGVLAEFAHARRSSTLTPSAV